MITASHGLLLLYSSTLLLLMTRASPDVRMTSDDLRGQDENELGSKRAWKDVQGSWGKRGWNDLETAWGKRAWERLNGAWGKRLTVNPGEESTEDEILKEINKRPEWNKLKGSWGKRAEAERAGWANLKGLWGKRSWDKLGNAWGKRLGDGDDKSLKSNPLETLHALNNSDK